ncbi:hypothetical protein H0V99_01165, partial [Candidatus Saccharibacteria bacterium]|nr:hypothetical protein [Candidatus Saccharibacteria bacterium]
YTLSEIDFAGYSEGTWSCSDNTQGTGRTVSVTLDEGENVTCTVSNDDQAATLIVTKVVINDDGGTKEADDFSYKINDGILTYFEVDGSNSHTVNAGTYSVVETADGDYQTSYSSDCTSVALAVGDTKTCTITNDDIAPTLKLKKIVVNDNGGDDLANEWTLTANGDGGNLINTTGTTIADTNGLEAQTAAAEAEAGIAYTLSESGPSGYTSSAWSCDGGSLDGSVLTLGLNQDVICTITNNDQAAELILVKNVINDNGGNETQSAFTPTINSTNSTWGTHAVDAGIYTVSELLPLPTGYTLNGVSCYVTGSPASGVSQATLLDSGTSRTCVVTNDDIAPKLTLIKYVTNDNGGDEAPGDWTLTATPSTGSVITGNGTGVTADGGVQDVTATANIGYTLSESGPSGYSVSVDWTCNGGSFNSDTNIVTLNEGDDITCTITNDDVAPVLTLYKLVVDDFGDDAVAEDWTLTATPTTGTVLSGDGEDGFVAKAASAHMTYALSESGPAGYTSSNWACTSSAGVFSEPEGNGTIRMSEGANVTCYITNTAEAPMLVVIKNLIKDNGGTEQVSDFTINVTGTDVSDNSFPAEASPGKSVTLDAGSYSVAEDAMFGYTTSYSADCTGTIDVGELKTCTVTNNDIAPVVNLEKITDPSIDEQDFTFEIKNNGTTYSSPVLDTDPLSLTTLDTYQTGSDFQAGSVVVTELETDGWFNEHVYCEAEDYRNGIYGVANFSAEIGETYYCYAENTKLADITVTKFNDLNEDGKWDEDEPTLEDWEINLEKCADIQILERVVSALDSPYCGDIYVLTVLSTTTSQLTGEDGSTTFEDLYPTRYKLSETLQDGWDQSGIYCEYENGLGYPVNDNSYFISLEAGEQIDCFVGNHREPYFLLEKSNNQPNPVTTGTTVTYTLKVTVPEDSGRIYGQHCEPEEEIILFLYVDEYDECVEQPVTVTDVLPDNFTYVNGSWTSSRSGVTTNINTNNPAMWWLTNAEMPFLSPGEVITLTYQTVIDTIVTPGEYPNIAHALGFSRSGEEILANQIDGEGNPFVTSLVTVYKPVVASGVVLGASILVNSGVDSRIAIALAITVLATALGMMVVSRRSKQSNVLVGLIMAGTTLLTLMVSGATVEAAQYWEVTMSKPAAVLNDESLIVSYQVATALPDASESFTVNLLVNGVTYGASQTLNNPDGGAGSFAVILPAEGSYTFQVTVNDGSESKTSVLATTTYDETPPASPVLVSKTRSGDTYTVVVKIPEGTECGTLQLYASQSTSFSASSLTLVGSQPCAAGQTLTFTFNRPGSDYFVASRSVDGSGNGSGFAAENVVTVINSGSNTTRASTASSNSSSTSTSGTTGSGVVGSTAASTSDDSEVAGTNDGEVQPASENEEPKNENEDSNSRTPWLVLIGLAAVGAIYYFVKRQRVEE